MNAVRYISIGLMVVASTFPASSPVAQSPTSAARSFDHCTGFIDSLPMTISTPGTWCLRRDLSIAIERGDAIAVNSDNVTIDCNNFTIDGLEASTDSLARGIHSEGRENITVRQCKIRGFLVGIDLSADFLNVRGGHLVEDNQLDLNIGAGMQVMGYESVVRSNIVRDTGTSSRRDTRGMIMAGSIDIIDNTISGVVIGTGIGVFENTAGSVSGNRVRDVRVGIRINHSEIGESLEVTGNHLNANPGGPKGSNTIGIDCRVEEGSGPVFANIIVGFDRPTVNCNAFDNTIAPRRGVGTP